MVIPVYLVALYSLGFPVLAYHAVFWFLYHLVDQSGSDFSWSCLWGTSGLLFLLLLAANWGVFWVLGRCLFIFDSLNHPQSLPHARPAVFISAGGLVGLAWSAGVAALLAWHNPGDATSLAVAHQAFDGWVGLGGILGLVATSGLQRGLALELPTAHMPPPPARIISGEMPVPIE